MKGFGLLEIVIAVSIISATIFSLSFVFIIANKLEGESLNKIRANFLAEEGLEALRFLRDKGWSGNLSALAPGTTYYLSFNAASSVWSISTSDPGLIDNLFSRKVTVENVYRNSADDIVSSGGILDPDTKKFNVSVEWQGRSGSAPTPAVNISTYLSDVFDN